MRSFIAALALLSVGATAIPAPSATSSATSSSASAPIESQCLDAAAASKVATNFGSLISAYSNKSANAYLTADFEDYSDSVNTLINSGCTGPKILGQATFVSRADFEAGQGGQPNITFNIKNVWSTCGTVIVRWSSPLPNPTTSQSDFHPEEEVTGIIVLETVYQGSDCEEPYLIKTSYSEFNSGAWLTDLGVFKPSNCSASSSSKVKRSLDKGVPAAFLLGHA